MNKSLFITFVMILLGSAAMSQPKQIKTKNINQLVQHEFATTYCSAGTFQIQLMVTYSNGGSSYNVISPAVTNLAGGSSAMLSVNLISTAVVTAKKIKITCDDGVYIYDLADDADVFIQHPMAYDWLNCTSTDYFHFNDFGNDFFFSFTSAGGL